MKVIAKTGENDIATVYVAKSGGDLIEFVESVQPPLPLASKWVLVVSSMVGCPVKCIMCDAGGNYKRRLSQAEILFQIDYMIKQRFPSGKVPVVKFKIQFARVGEPTFNFAVLDVLEILPGLYEASGLIPTISTVAPNGSELFLEKLIAIKNRLYPCGKFQLQFSIHSTDVALRDNIIPIKKWGFAKIAAFGEQFYVPGDRKIALNFALANNSILEVKTLTKYFDPQKFLIKITPVNPTLMAAKNQILSFLNESNISSMQELVLNIKQSGYDVIVSVGEFEENKIGSNCGQYIEKLSRSNIRLQNSYKSELEYL